MLVLELIRRAALLVVVVVGIWALLAHNGHAQLAGGMQFPGPGTAHSVGATYSGSGDIISFSQWGSCARVYNLAKASTATSMCDLVQGPSGASPGTAVGTLRGSATGLVDLSAYFAGSVTPSAACALVTGGCVVSKIYDQVGTNHWTQATNSRMPLLAFAAANGLPGMQFDTASVSFLESAAVTVAQPFTLSGVYKNTVNLQQGGLIGSDASIQICMGSSSASAQTYAVAGGAGNGFAAADNTFHAINDLFNGASSIINLNGSENAAAAVGTNAFSSTPVRIGRCDGTSMTGIIMEAGMISGSSTPTNRSDLSTNQHSAANGYNF